MFGYLIRLGLIFLAVWLVQGRRLDFASGTRSDHHRHAPRAPGLGAEVRRALARLPGPQAQPVHRQTRHIAAHPLTTETDITCSHSSSRRSTSAPLAGHLPDVQQDRAHRRAARADRHRALPPRRSQGSAGRRRPACATSPRPRRVHRGRASSCRRSARTGLRWTPFLLTLFIFIYLCNLPGIIPIFADAGHGPHGASRCSWRCSSGSSTSASASSTRASVLHHHAVAARACPRR